LGRTILNSCCFAFQGNDKKDKFPRGIKISVTTTRRFKFMRKYFSLAAMAAILTLVIGCGKPTPQAEIQNWEKNKKAHAEAMVKYPSYKEVMNTKLTDAQKIWDEAQKISKVDEKALKMREANAKLMELPNQLGQIPGKAKGVTDTIAKLNAMKLTKVQDKTRKGVVVAANTAVKEATDALSAKVENEEAAKKLVSDSIGKLISTQGDVDRTIKSFEPKKPATTAKKKK
jgi:hypothetical protein